LIASDSARTFEGLIEETRPKDKTYRELRDEADSPRELRNQQLRTAIFSIPMKIPIPIPIWMIISPPIAAE